MCHSFPSFFNLPSRLTSFIRAEKGASGEQWNSRMNSSNISQQLLVRDLWEILNCPAIKGVLRNDGGWRSLETAGCAFWFALMKPLMAPGCCWSALKQMFLYISVSVLCLCLCSLIFFGIFSKVCPENDALCSVLWGVFLFHWHFCFHKSNIFLLVSWKLNPIPVFLKPLTPRTTSENIGLSQYRHYDWC